MNEPHASKPRQSLLRTSGFWAGAAGGMALICVLVLLLWSANDASFGLATWKAKVRLGMERVQAANPQAAEALGIMDAIRAIKWDSLGKRVVALYALYGLGLVSTLALGLLTAKQVTAKRTIAFCCVLVAWIGLLATRAAVDEWRTQRQVVSILPRFERAAAALSDEWPAESGEIPPAVRFLISAERYPDVLIVRGDRNPYPLHEDFGLMITRGGDGIIRFDLASAADSCVEYHPHGTQPSAYTSGFGYPSPPVASVSELKDDWYLVRYGRK